MQLVAESVYRLGHGHHNFYVVTAGGRATVIDAGGSRELPLLVDGLKSIGLGLDRVDVVLITHAHSDHLGFAREVAESGIPVKVHEDEAAYATDGSKGQQVQPMDLPLWRPRVWAFLIEMIRAGAAQEFRLREVGTVVDGEVLDVPGRPRVLATPGHTAGHAAYVLDETDVLFSGDALVTEGLIVEKEGPQLLGAMFHHDVETARDSLERIAREQAKILLPGHGAPWYGQISEAVALAKASL